MHALAAVSLLLVAAVAAPTAARAEPLRVDVSTVPVDSLKETYLACDRLSRRTVLDFGTAVHCSTHSEALLRRGFDGDFEALLAWWRVASKADAETPLAQRR